MIMLHVSAITAINRQNFYKNVQRKVNIEEERGLSLTSIVLLFVPRLERLF